MTARLVRIRLSDIRSEVAGIRELTKGVDLEAFASSWAMTRAVQHALLIIAEASKHIPPEMKASQPVVPWHKIHGLGNLLRHEYRRVDSAILWSVVTEHLEALDKAAETLLKEADR